MDFEKEKKQFLSKPDKSSKGSMDKEIKPLLGLINKRKEYCTTSSCSGRIVLLRDSKKKIEKAFVFASHDKVAFSQMKKSLAGIPNTKETIYLKHEPAIMHVACRSFEDAMKPLTMARNCGWKRSGMISRSNVIELISTEQLAAPVAICGKAVIDDAYLKILVREANSKLERTRNKISRLTSEMKNI